MANDVLKTLIAEAYGEGPEGMRRVAETIINRAAIRGMTPEQVVREANQYTGLTSPGDKVRGLWGDDAAIQAAQAAWELALKPGDPTGGADHYYAPGTVAKPGWANSMKPTGDYGGHSFFSSRPIPPGEIPNVVASQTDTTPPRPVAPVMPTSLPPMLAAQRNLQATGQNTSAMYDGIFPPVQREPISRESMVFGRGVSDTVERSLAQQDQGLAASLQSYAQNRRAPSPPSFAGQERGTYSRDYIPPSVNPVLVATEPYGWAETIATIPTTPQPQRQSLPELPPSAIAPRNSPNSPISPTGPGPTSLATVQDMYGRPGGVGQPPATRSVPSVPLPAAPAMGMTEDRGAMPTRSAFLSEFGFANPRETVAAPLPTTAIPGPSRVGTNERLGPGIPVASATAAGLGQLFPPTPYYDVATALDVVPNAVPRLPIGPGLPPPPVPRPLRSGVNVQMPTPIGQRPTLPMPRAITGFPTALAQRPNPNALRVTVNGAGSYNAPQRAPTPTREQMLAAIRARSRGPTAFGHGGTIDGAVQPIGTLSGRR